MQDKLVTIDVSAVRLVGAVAVASLMVLLALTSSISTGWWPSAPGAIWYFVPIAIWAATTSLSRYEGEAEYVAVPTLVVSLTALLYTVTLTMHREGMSDDMLTGLGTLWFILAAAIAWIIIYPRLIR